jgi:hypothetical protein
VAEYRTRIGACQRHAAGVDVVTVLVFKLAVTVVFVDVNAVGLVGLGVINM